MRPSATRLLSLLLLAALPGLAFAQTGPSTLTLHFSMLPTLDEAAAGHYEGWAIVGGSPISTGKFNVNMDGTPVALGGGAVIDEFDAGVDITAATDIKITLEPPGDSDDIPSGLVVVAGAVSGLTADLTAAIPNLDMLTNMTTGAFFLATPSDNPDNPDNNNQGIWYLTMPGPEPGFQNLPDIGPNWNYEGWVVDVSGAPMPYTTGKFSMASGADSDEAGCMGGGPPFPGQDFVDFQCGPTLNLDSGDFVTVLTIEPVPDNSAMPFLFKPLAGPIPTDGVGMNAIPMTNQVADTFPTGQALLAGTTATESVSLSAVKALY